MCATASRRSMSMQPFCPEPELPVLHAFDTLFTAGPCSLGSAVNKALGYHGQTQFEPVGSPTIRGGARIVVLKQNAWDMGAHRSVTHMPISQDACESWNLRLVFLHGQQEGERRQYAQCSILIWFYRVLYVYT